MERRHLQLQKDSEKETEGLGTLEVSWLFNAPKHPHSHSLDLSNSVGE